jgi:adenylate cyclase
MSRGRHSRPRPFGPQVEPSGAVRRLLRMLGRRVPRVLLGAQLVALAVLGLRGAGWLQPLELAWYDAMVRAHAGEATSDRLAVIVAEEADIDRLGWPLPDAVLARLIERLLEAGAAAVAVDIYRDRPVGEGAEALAALVDREPRVVWAYRLGDGTHRGVRPPAALAGTPRAAFADVVADAGEVVRRGLLAAEDPQDGRVVLSLGAALAERVQGARLRPAGDDLGFGAGVLKLVEEPYGPYAMLDAAGYQVLLAWRGGFVRYRLGDALEGRLPGLAGRGVLVGLDSLSVRDSFATPLSTGLARQQPMPGVILHAQVAGQLLRVAAGGPGAPRPPARGAEHAMVWAGAMLGAAIPLAAPAAAWALVSAGAGALAVGGLLAGAALAHGLGWLLPAMPAMLALLGGAVLAAWLLQGVGHRQRAQLRRTFEHYLDPRLVQAMAGAEDPPRLGGEQREITALFTDLAGFTALSETMPAPELALLLNDYFEGLGQAALAEGGLVADFIGDGMIALFGAPLARPDHAARAVAAARAMDDFARDFAARCAGRGLRFGVTRIGVHTGPALVGNLGMRSRLKYGALGDTLNLASRLESLNRWTGTRLLVSATTAAGAPDAAWALLGDARVAGRSERVAVLTPGMPACAEPYAAAIAAIRRGEAAVAQALLDPLVQAHPDHAAAAFHLRRLGEGLCSLELDPPGK